MYDCMAVLYLHMDPRTRAAWRLVSRATCQAVYCTTRCLRILRPTQQCSSGRPDCFTSLLDLITGLPGQHPRYHSTLPLRLLEACPNLKVLSCRQFEELQSLHGLPPGLEVLDISGTSVRDLSPLSEHCPRLRALRFSHPKRANVSGYSSLSACVRLQALILTGHTALGASGLAAALHPLTGLQELVLSGCLSLGGSRTKYLAASIQKLTALRALDLSSCGLRSRAASALPPVIEGLTSLQRLNLGGNGNLLGPECVASLAPSFKVLTGLQALCLSRTHLLPAGMVALAPSLYGLTVLRTLDLSHNDNGPEGASALAPTLNSLRGMQSLRLSCNALRAEGAAALAPSIQGLTGLLSLDLRGNRLGFQGATALAAALGKLSALKLLDLSRNRLGAEGAAVLAPSIQTLTCLQELDLSDNDLGAEGVVALAPAIGLLEGLQRLYLFANKVGAAGGAALAPAVRMLPKLTHLYLDAPPVQDIIGEDNWESEWVGMASEKENWDHLDH